MLLILLFIFIIVLSINTSYVESLDVNEFNSRIKFDTNDYNVRYHDTAEEIESRTPSGSWLSNNGKLEYFPWSKIANTIIYYKPGSYEYGASSYIPSYKDSIYLSRTR